jgi:phage recombination protein Bet
MATQEQAKATSNGNPSARTSQKLVGRLAEKFGVSADALLGCLRDTAFKQGKDEAPLSDTELAAALTIAERYDLDPFAKEIYVFRSKGKLLITVPIDGWLKIINRQMSYEGAKFTYTFDEKGGPESVTCELFRSDRKLPTIVTEFFCECKRGTDPWGSHPRRMLRHKALIQAARYAFGLSGIVDDDEAAGIIEGEQVHIQGQPQRALPEPSVDLEAEIAMSGARQGREPEPALPSLPNEQPDEAPAPEANGVAPAFGERAAGTNQPAAAPPPAALAKPAPAQAADPGDTARLWKQWCGIRADLQPEDLARVKGAVNKPITATSPAAVLTHAITAAQDMLR